MKKEIVKLVVYVPLSHADKIRQAIGQAGAGKTGKYEFCSFSVKGIGRFKPLSGAKPFIGKVGKLKKVVEERIETICFKKDLDKVLKVLKKAHPYEKPAIDIYPLLLS